MAFSNLHDEAESIAIEQVRWWRHVGETPFTALCLMDGPWPADKGGVGWDDVYEAACFRWMQTRIRLRRLERLKAESQDWALAA